MRRQTILLAAALAVATPSAAITQSRTETQAALASRDPATPTARDRLTLKIKDAKAASYSIAPADEASLLSGLAKAHKLPELAPVEAPRLIVGPDARPASGAAVGAAGAGSTTPDTGSFAPHHGFARVHEFVEDHDRVSLNIAPVRMPTYRDGDVRETLRADGEAYGSAVSGVAVGLSFKLN